MKSTLIRSLEGLAERDPSVVLLTGDLGFKIFDRFRTRYPERFLNVGVAEANMIGVAAGLALSGKSVYCYSIAPFLTMRCLEQIRVDLCYQNLKVRLIGAGAGWSYGLEGMTHHAIEDIAVMRSLPNMTVVAPGDPLEAEALMVESATHKGPIYIRLGKDNDPPVHTCISGFRIGKGITIQRGDGIVVIATGTMLHTAQHACDMLAGRGMSVGLTSMHTIKPLDDGLVVDCAARAKAIFTVEEHSIVGGLGSAVAEVLAESGYGGVFRRFGVPDRYCGDVGGPQSLREKHGLSANAVADRILREVQAEVTSGRNV